MKHKKISTIILLIILCLSALASNTVAPLTTMIAKQLNVAINLVVLIVTTYFFGNATGQILSGKLSDTIGRKKVLIYGITLFIVSSITISFLYNIYLIILLSFIQGIGGGVLVTVYKSSIFDLYKGTKAQNIFSYLSSIYAAVNIIAPFLGLYINKILGWRYIYALISLSSFITLIAIIFLFPKIKMINDNKKTFLSEALKIISNKNYMRYSIIVLISYSLILLMITILPILFHDLAFMNVSFLSYSYAGMILFYMIGNFISVKFIANPQKSISMSLYLLLTTILLLSITIYYKNALFLYLSLGIANIFSGILLPLYSGLAIKIFPEQRGLASSINGAIQIGGGALMISIIAMITNLNIDTLIGFIVCLIISMLYIKRSFNKELNIKTIKNDTVETL